MPHLLVVEDDHATQTLYRALLGKARLDCTVVADGKQALEALRKRRYDAVVLDLLLPVVNGFQASRHRRVPAGGR